MEIEFNPGRVAVPRAGGYSANSTDIVATRRDTAPASARISDNTTANSAYTDPGTDAANSLQRQLSTADVRPDKVAAAKALVANEGYPPDFILDRIAVLLAVQTKETQETGSNT